MLHHPPVQSGNFYLISANKNKTKSTKTYQQVRIKEVKRVSELHKITYLIGKQNLLNCKFLFICHKKLPTKKQEKMKKGLILYKLRCVIPMVVNSILSHAEFGPNDHREDPALFSGGHRRINLTRLIVFLLSD